MNLPRWRRRGSALGLLVIVVVWTGYARYFHQASLYDAKALDAHDNMQFVGAWNMRRSDDVITVVGREAPLEAVDAHASDQYGWLTLDVVGRRIALAGTRGALCDGDDVAVSGTYRYDPSGGVLVVSDPQNVAPRFHAYAGRIAFIRGLVPSWCGFPGLPINSY